MRNLSQCILGLSITMLWACTPAQNDTQSMTVESVQALADKLQVTYQVITNRTDEQCDKAQTQGLCFQAQLSLSLDGNYVGRDWRMYFSHMAPIQSEQSQQFDIRHINGDLHELIPTNEFTGFIAGQTYDVPLRSGFWHLSETDIMPNYFLVDGADNAFVVQSTVAKIDPDTQLEILPHAIPFTTEDRHFKRTERDALKPATAAWLYQENASLEWQDVSSEILPTPKKMTKLNTGQLGLSQGLNFQFNGFDANLLTAALTRLNELGVATKSDGHLVRFVRQPDMAKEAYQLQITQQGIRIKASTETGAFYGLQSLASVLDIRTMALPLIQVDDEPRFEYRGMHLDVSRNFKSKQFVLTLLEQMAAYKLNRFHFHLADDEGWRIAIPDLPELTEVGAFRCYDSAEQNCVLPQLGSGPERESQVNGYYTVDDYIEILEFAKARHIDVIPSMDMPGHSRAAIKAITARQTRLLSEGQVAAANEFLLHDVEDSTEYLSIQFYNDNTINACLDSTYRFIDKVIDEVIVMHERAGMPLNTYHIGADETAGAWLNSPACQQLLAQNVNGIESAEDIAGYFIERVSNMLAKRGILTAGWSDGMSHTHPDRMPKVAQSHAWSPLIWDGHASAHEQANRGWKVVVSSPDALYFDFPYQADAKERGYYWAARYVSNRKVFEFMPENLPALAEIWTDREGHPYQADDTKTKMHTGNKFFGMQGQLWSETVRTDRQAAYMIFPRLYALAERAWHQASWELPYDYNGKLYNQSSAHISANAHNQRQQDWQRFANVIGQKVLPKAEQEQVFYRLPTVGAVIDNNQLKVNVELPGLMLEYKLNDQAWLPYLHPVSVSKNDRILVRSAAFDGKRKGRALEVNH